MPSTRGRYLLERDLDRLPVQELEKYLINEEIGKAIKIPQNIIEILLKFSSAEEIAGFTSDVFALAIAYRRASNVTNSLKQWKSDNPHKDPFLNCFASVAFCKYLKSCLLSPLFKNYFSENEVKKLIEFFAKCPHGYKFKRNYIFAHSELLPIIT